MRRCPTCNLRLRVDGLCPRGCSPNIGPRPLPNLDPREVAVLTELVKLGLAGAHPMFGGSNTVTMHSTPELVKRIGAHLRAFVDDQDPEQGLTRELTLEHDRVTLVTRWTPERQGRPGGGS